MVKRKAHNNGSLSRTTIVVSAMPIRPNSALPPSPTPNPEELGHQVRRLLAEAQALSARLAALNEIATAIQGTLDSEYIFQTLATQSRWLIDFQHCSVALAEGTHYRILALRRDQPPLTGGATPLVKVSSGGRCVIDTRFARRTLPPTRACPRGCRPR